MQAFRVVDIDDWAWRKGQRYGALICDLERRRVVNLLPNRVTSTVEVWLRLHPGIKLVAQDRDAAYSRAATRALSHAV